MNGEVATKASERATAACAERLEREIVAAWRAGYSYLYVVHQQDTMAWSGRADAERVSVSVGYVPAYSSELFSGVLGPTVIERYNLSALSRDRVKEHTDL